MTVVTARNPAWGQEAATVATAVKAVTSDTLVASKKVCPILTTLSHFME